MTNFFKRISSVAMAAAMATTMVVSASANDMNIDDFDAMPNVSGERIAYNAEGTQIILYPGEVLVGDTIVGEKITSSPNLPSVSTLSATDDCPNYATSTEYIQLWYTGYIQFRASYLRQHRTKPTKIKAPSQTRKKSNISPKFCSQGNSN